MFSAVGVVDLKKSDPEAAEDVYKTLSQVGFAYVINHNVPSTFMERVEQIAHEFFALPDEVKMSLAKKNYKPDNKNMFRGYTPLTKATDEWKEIFEMSNELLNVEPKTKRDAFLFDKNVWPQSGDRQWDATFRSVMVENFQEMERLAARLTRLIAIAFGLEADYFVPFFKDGITSYKLIHYPPNDQLTKSGLSCCEHFDSGLLTLLQQDQHGGLQVQNDSGEWIDVPYIENSFVINIGRTLQKWTGSKLRANKHRVLAVRGHRYSFPMFYQPHPNVEIGPLPVEGKRAEGYEQFEPFTYGVFGLNNLRRLQEYQFLNAILDD